MIVLYQANRLETLADLLARELLAPESAPDPLRSDLVVVPNPGTGRWLVHRLAEGQGIMANLELPLPASFFWRVMQAWLPVQETSPFDRETLTWRIQAALPGLLDARDFSGVRHYLEGDDPSLRLYQLATRIADLFDQYLVFRPEMVLAWEAGKDEGWPSQLWRRITEKEGGHRARLLTRLIREMDGPPAAPRTLPGRLFLFGLNALPPVYVEILRRLGNHRDLHLYHLNPCREYWSDIRSERALAQHEDPQGAFLDLGNPLLASMGHVGQVFLDQLLSLDAESRAHFEAPAGKGVLQQVQSDILALRDGREKSRRLPLERWPSIQLHGSHTRLREVQVLHDNLLRCLEEIEGLRPRDILVMAPDMAAYAPFVEAVFGTREEEQHMPYSIGDRAPAGETPLAEALGWLLQLPTSRLEASEVLALLEVDAVQHRFGIDEEALERIRTWVREASIRWAADEAHRQELGLPGDQGLHSWRFGLRRLFLGYVTPADGENLLYSDEVVPYLHIDSGELTWAGALQELLDRLDSWRRRLAAPRDPAQWRERLVELLQDFFEAGEEEEVRLLQGLRQRLDDWVQQSRQGGFEGEVSLAVVRELLETVLGDSSQARGFLDVGITFSNLLPMRALPFRVICLLGMNDSDFPRAQSKLSFELMAASPRRADRDRRRDDRYLFLETLVSARDCLLISYQSRDARSDKPRLPAEVVSELMDYLDGCYARSKELPSRLLFVQHPLQPFSSRYFSGEEPALFSYDAVWAIGAPQEARSPFFEGPLEPMELETRLGLDELIGFYRNPAVAFLTRRLAMRLPGGEELVEDSEPFFLDGLASWQVRKRLLDARLEGREPLEVARRLRGEGQLPHGLPGTLELARAEEAVATFGERLAPVLESCPGQTPLEIDLEIDGWLLEGNIERHTGEGVLDFRVGRLRPQDRLGLWIRHLAVAAQTGAARRSCLVAEDATLFLGAIDGEEATGMLGRLLQLYRDGLERPLHFFPDTAWALVTGDAKWRRLWEGDDHRAGERDDPAVRLLFRNADPVDARFEEQAEAIYAPLLERMEEPS